MDPVVKLNVRRRVKDKNNKEDGSEDEEFDLERFQDA